MTLRRRVAIGLFVCAAVLADGGAARAQDARVEDVDAIVARATMLRRLNRKAEALAGVRRAAVLAPERQDVAQLRAQLEQEVRGSEAMVGFDYQSWDDAREAWREPRLSFRKNTARGPVIARASRVERFGLSDEKLELELYPAFHGGYGALAAGVASNGDLYPRSTFSAEVFKTLPAQLEASVGFRRLNLVSRVNISTASLGSYIREYFLGARIHHVTGGASGTAVSMSARRYLADDGEYIGAHASAGSVREGLRTASDFGVRRSRSLGLDAMLVVRRRWLVTMRQSFGRDQLASGASTPFLTLDVSLGARFF